MAGKRNQRGSLQFSTVTLYAFVLSPYGRSFQCCQSPWFLLPSRSKYYYFLGLIGDLIHPCLSLISKTVRDPAGLFLEISTFGLDNQMLARSLCVGTRSSEPRHQAGRDAVGYTDVIAGVAMHVTNSISFKIAFTCKKSRRSRHITVVHCYSIIAAYSAEKGISVESESLIART